MKLFVFYRFGLYRGMWRYTGLKDLENIIKASLVSTSAVIVIILMATRFHGFPCPVFLIDCILTIFLIGGFRMGIRMGLQYSKQGAIPFFMKQIADGGPVTVTDARMTRYFMTINEAVQLILQAGAIGEGGEIFILKMGMPVKIIDMARDLIRLSGFEPDKDIQIQITGLRPGEKLYEELITEGEGIVPTPYDKIMVLKCNGHCKGMSYKDLERGIKDLLLLAVKNDVEGIKVKLREMVPVYTPRTGPEAEVEEREEEKGHFEVIHLNIDGKKVPVDKEACLSERQKKEYEALHGRV